MGMFGRNVAALAAAGLLIGTLPVQAAVPRPHPAAKAQAKLPAVDDSIAIAVNGDELAPDPAPRIVGKGGGRLVVPVIRIYSALGIAVSRNGNAITASAPGKQIVIHIGSAEALIDGRAVTMESPAITIEGATYVPLRFVAESLGAQATFNAKASRVEIVSSLVGRNPALEQRAAGGTTQIVGTVSAIDLNSQPQSVTVQRGPSVRTVSITSDAKVLLQDVVARTSTPGALTDVHVGDAVSVFVLRDGHIDSVIVRYASRNGTIAAVSSSQFVLNTGFILSPDRSTTIQLNSEPATFADLKVGDSVVVRLNPDTNEKRQIIVSRAVAPVPASTGAVAIASFKTDAKTALRAGDSFAVSLIGTPGGKASFDIGTYVVGLPLTETQPGTYGARYTVPANVNFGQTAIYGHLNVGRHRRTARRGAGARSGFQHAAANRRYRAVERPDRQQQSPVDLCDVPRAGRRRHQRRERDDQRERSRRDAVVDPHRSIHHLQPGQCAQRRTGHYRSARRGCRGQHANAHVVVSGPRAMKRVLGALLALVLLAGCGNLDESGTPELIMARVKDAVNLDPSHATEGLSLDVSAEVMEGLVMFKPGTFDVIPSLATSWKTSPDGSRWTFKLRPNAKFSDGTPADAAAVKFNFDRWRLQNDPDHGPFSYAYWVSEFGGFSDDPKNPGVVRDVIAEDPRTVTFVLSGPSGTFLRNIAMESFLIGSPTAIKRDPKAFEQMPIGSGPYVVREWLRDDHITLDANPTYTGVMPKPEVKTVVIRDIPDQATSVLSIQKGELAMLTDPRPDDAVALAAVPDIHIVNQPSNNLAYIAMNVEKKPFDNVLVRRAVAQAIDIPGIIKGLYGPGTTEGDNWTPPGMLGENQNIKIWPHDVAAAKKLLAQAGFPNGFSTELYLPTSPRPYMPDPQRLAEAIQANLKDAGINVTLEPFEFGVFLAKVQNGEHPMCLIGWSGDNGDPDNFYYPLLDQDSAVKPFAQNYTFWRDPQFHKLMLAGQRSVNERERRKIYEQAAQLVHDDVPAISLLHTPVPVALRSSVHGFVPSPNTEYHFELMKT